MLVGLVALLHMLFAATDSAAWLPCAFQRVVETPALAALGDLCSFRPVLDSDRVAEKGDPGRDPVERVLGDHHEEGT